MVNLTGTKAWSFGHESPSAPWLNLCCLLTFCSPRHLSGLLTLVAPLDFEVSREYYLSVEGSRGKSSLSDITTVIINVTDVNDNTPVFGQGGYSVEITEDLTPGALVMKVSGADTDSCDSCVKSLSHHTQQTGLKEV